MQIYYSTSNYYSQSEPSLLSSSLLFDVGGGIIFEILSNGLLLDPSSGSLLLDDEFAWRDGSSLVGSALSDGVDSLSSLLPSINPRLAFNASFNCSCMVRLLPDSFASSFFFFDSFLRSSIFFNFDLSPLKFLIWLIKSERESSPAPESPASALEAAAGGGGGGGAEEESELGGAGGGGLIYKFFLFFKNN